MITVLQSRFAVEAITYAEELGWYVGPVCWPDGQGACACGRGHSTQETGKAPLTPRGHLGFTSDPGELARLGEQYPEANLAVDLERSGLVVVDCDSAAAVAEFEGQHSGALAVAVTGKGKHFYFRRSPDCPATRITRSGQSGAIDILSKGFTILPPSLHRTGRRYEWQSWFRVLEDAPGFVTEALQTAELRRVAPEHYQVSQPAPMAGGLPDSVDEVTRRIWDGAEAVHGEDGGVDRSETLFKLACGLARAGLSTAEVVSYVALYDAQQPSPKYTNRRDSQVRYRELASRAAASVQQAGELILDDDEGEDDGGGKRAKGIPQATWRDLYLSRYPRTAFGRGAWRRYTSGVWIEVAKEEVERELADLMGRRATSNTVSAVRNLLQAKVFVRDEAWDGADNALVCANGTLEVDTGKLRSHSPLDYATESVPYACDPVAQAPSWQWFLSTSFPADVVAFLQEFAGYCLTHETKHELTLWLLAAPGAGKSTLLLGLQTMLDGLYGSLSLKSLANQFALAEVPGKRLLVAAEQPAGYIENSDTLNSLISGDPIRIEQKYKDGYTFNPTAKVAWAMNERPKVSDPNNGIFRRVAVLPMAPIPEDRQDKNLKDRIRAEGPGILNWALGGLHRLRERGRFAIPQVVAQSSREFQQHNDIPALFIEEMCEAGPALSVGSEPLYLSYVHYCKTSGYLPKSRKNLSDDWRRLGFEHVKRKGRPFWKGLALATNTTE